MGEPLAQLVRLEVGLHVGDLDVGLVGVQRSGVHDVRVLDDHHVLGAEARPVEVLWRERNTFIRLVDHSSGEVR